MMLAAVMNGDAKELAELIRQDPGFDVNIMVLDGDGLALLHLACLGDHRSSIIPLLLAHPAIDVNVKDHYECTPFSIACANGYTSCVREMLKDSRVELNEPIEDGRTPLWYAAYYDDPPTIRWWIASGREMDLETPGVMKTDALGVAKEQGRTEVVTLLERFKECPGETRHVVRMEVGWYDEAAAEMFALKVFVSDGLLQTKGTTTSTPAARYFSIAAQLPLELQMVLCFRQMGSDKDIITGKVSEVAFKSLARRLW